MEETLPPPPPPPPIITPTHPVASHPTHPLSVHRGSDMTAAVTEGRLRWALLLQEKSRTARFVLRLRNSVHSDAHTEASHTRTAHFTLKVGAVVYQHALGPVGHDRYSHFLKGFSTFSIVRAQVTKWKHLLRRNSAEK